jgi:hypothetical protein
MDRRTASTRGAEALCRCDGIGAMDSAERRIASRVSAIAVALTASSLAAISFPSSSAAGLPPDPTPAVQAAPATATFQPPATTAICDSTTALTLIGMDTESGLMLFAVAGPGGGAGSWMVEIEAGGREAHAHPERPGARFGGSVGPGPVLAVEPCGSDCLQPVRFDHGAWRPLGESLAVPSAGTAAATYDGSGAPWLVAHTEAAQEGLYQAFAFRYEARAWKSHGSLGVTAIGQPQVVPAPQRRDGVVSGTGLFAASGQPMTWVKGLPGLPPNRRGQLLALTGTEAAYLSGDGVAYLSSDSGKTWRRSTWTPWGGGDTTGIWRQGTDYGIDLPFGDHRGELQHAWFDRRSPSAERIVLTRLGSGGAWTQLADAPTDVTTRSGEHLPVTQLLLPRGDTWVLLSGCAATANGSGLVLRTFEKGQLSEPRFIPIAVDAAKPPPREPTPQP